MVNKKMSRPPTYNKEMQKKADGYLAQWKLTKSSRMPSQGDLAKYLGVTITCVKNWKVHEKFLATLQEVKAAQKEALINYGLSGENNAAITKLVLHSHGMSDSVKTETTTVHEASPELREVLDRYVK